MLLREKVISLEKKLERSEQMKAGCANWRVLYEASTQAQLVGGYLELYKAPTFIDLVYCVMFLLTALPRVCRISLFVFLPFSL